MWIEIIPSVTALIAGKSRLMEACGLKYSVGLTDRSRWYVTPYGGVWIEISSGTAQSLPAGSRLMEACGLKFQQDIIISRIS